MKHSFWVVEGALKREAILRSALQKRDGEQECHNACSLPSGLSDWRVSLPARGRTLLGDAAHV
ncbi:MAG TPA: hypothetical protein ACFE0H_07580 [Elainellaceae cyanobacterium]